MDKQRLNIIKSALHLAAEQGWDYISLSDIAAQAQCGLSDIHDLYDDKDDILRGYGRYLDRQVIDAFQGQELEGDSIKDRLFDILMERFDILNEDRAAILSILKSYQFDPKRAAIALPHVAKSMSWMLELAGDQAEGWRGCAKVLGLTGVYLDIAMRVWAKDDSPDMSRTMAALDKSLGYAESAANSFIL